MGLPMHMGSYLLVVSAEGRETVPYPVLLGRGQSRSVHVVLPRLGTIPEGFRYVAGGPFLFGTLDEKLIDQGYAPLHERVLPSFLMAATEVTFAEWLPYYAEAPAARKLQGLLVDDGGRVQMDMLDAMNDPQRPHVGELYDYGQRRRSPLRVDWTRWPVFNLNLAEAGDYAKWVSAKRGIGVRLCTEEEWEKGARGADGRAFPHASRLAPGDASTRLTDGEELQGIRWVDPVGSFPASRSVYGIDDTVGNVGEWTTAPGQAVVKSSWWRDVGPLELWTRFVRGDSHQGLDVGFRLCSTPSE
jgi:formylglycine-generating enzyme required for sulfatase activity